MIRYVLVLLFIAIQYSQNNTIEKEKFFCPPCGCEKDNVVYASPGYCIDENCSMILMKGKWEDYTNHPFAETLRHPFFIHFYNFLIYPSIIFGLILSTVLLVSLRKKRRANIFLSMLITAITLNLFKYYLMELNLDIKTDHLSLFFPLSYIVVIGPSIYFYTKFVTFYKNSFRKIDYLHFIPAIIVFIIYLVLFFKPGQEKHMIVHSVPFITFAITEHVLSILLSIVYAILSIKLLYKHELWVTNHFSDLTQLNLGWLKRVIYSVLLISIIWIVILITDWIIMGTLIYDYEHFKHHYFPIWIVMSLVVYWIGYNGFKKSELLNTDINIEEEKQKLEKYPTEYTKRVIHLMEVDLLYLEQELTLSTLAKKAGYSTKIVTSVLNQSLDKNFYTFVNEFRVAEFKKRLNDPKNEHLTLLAIAFDCGFSSKSAFNSIFKKITGETPKQYKNRVLKKS